MHFQSKCNPSAIAPLLVPLLISIIAGCQSNQMAHRSFPPEKRHKLQAGGPHKGTAETLTVFFSYSYSLHSDNASARTMQIGGSLNRFKMGAESMTLHIHFLDEQGDGLMQKVIYALGSHHGRDTLIRPSTSFNTKLEVPDEAAYFAFNSRTRRSRGRR